MALLKDRKHEHKTQTSNSKQQLASFDKAKTEGVKLI